MHHDRPHNIVEGPPIRLWGSYEPPPFYRDPVRGRQAAREALVAGALTAAVLGVVAVLARVVGR